MESDSITLTSSDGKNYQIKKKSASLSGLLRHTIQDFTDQDIVLPLAEISSSTLENVIKYLSHWDGQTPPAIIPPITSNKISDHTDTWSAAYIDSLTLEELGDHAIAANYLDLQPLIDLASAKIVSIVKEDIGDEEFFKKFGLNEMDYCEEQLEKIKEENEEWLLTDTESIFRIDLENK